MSHLSSDYTKEGHLHKTGPSPNDVYKKRWCTLGGRKLMYHVEPLDAYPKVCWGCVHIFLAKGSDLCMAHRACIVVSKVERE